MDWFGAALNFGSGVPMGQRTPIARELPFVLRNIDPDCFFCRIMRSFAISGLGGAFAGYTAIYLGSARSDAVYWAVAGAILALGLFSRRRRAGRDRAR